MTADDFNFTDEILENMHGIYFSTNYISREMNVLQGKFDVKGRVVCLEADKCSGIKIRVQQTMGGPSDGYFFAETKTDDYGFYMFP